MRALVIDDSRAIRLILGQILKALKFEVIEADRQGFAIMFKRYSHHTKIMGLVSFYNCILRAHFHPNIDGNPSKLPMVTLCISLSYSQMWCMGT